MEKNDNLGLMLGLGLGAMVGAGAALLLAPVSGKEAREFLAKKAIGPVRSKLTGMGQELRVNIAEISEDFKKKGSAASKDEPELARGGKTAGRQPYPKLEA